MLKKTQAAKKEDTRRVEFTEATIRPLRTRSTSRGSLTRRASARRTSLDANRPLNLSANSSQVEASSSEFDFLYQFSKTGTSKKTIANRTLTPNPHANPIGRTIPILTPPTQTPSVQVETFVQSGENLNVNLSRLEANQSDQFNQSEPIIQISSLSSPIPTVSFTTQFQNLPSANVENRATNQPISSTITSPTITTPTHSSPRHQTSQQNLNVSPTAQTAQGASNISAGSQLLNASNLSAEPPTSQSSQISSSNTSRISNTSQISGIEELPNNEVSVATQTSKTNSSNNSANSRTSNVSQQSKRRNPQNLSVSIESNHSSQSIAERHPLLSPNTIDLLERPPPRNRSKTPTRQNQSTNDSFNLRPPVFPQHPVAHRLLNRPRYQHPGTPFVTPTANEYSPAQSGIPTNSVQTPSSIQNQPTIATQLPSVTTQIPSIVTSSIITEPHLTATMARTTTTTATETTTSTGAHPPNSGASSRHTGTIPRNTNTGRPNSGPTQHNTNSTTHTHQRRNSRGGITSVEIPLQTPAPQPTRQHSTTNLAQNLAASAQTNIPNLDVYRVIDGLQQQQSRMQQEFTRTVNQMTSVLMNLTQRVSNIRNPGSAPFNQPNTATSGAHQIPTAQTAPQRETVPPSPPLPPPPAAQNSQPDMHSQVPQFHERQNTHEQNRMNQTMHENRFNPTTNAQNVSNERSNSNDSNLSYHPPPNNSSRRSSFASQRAPNDQTFDNFQRSNNGSHHNSSAPQQTHYDQANDRQQYDTNFQNSFNYQRPQNNYNQWNDRQFNGRQSQNIEYQDNNHQFNRQPPMGPPGGPPDDDDDDDFGYNGSHNNNFNPNFSANYDRQYDSNNNFNRYRPHEVRPRPQTLESQIEWERQRLLSRQIQAIPAIVKPTPESINSFIRATDMVISQTISQIEDEFCTQQIKIKMTAVNHISTIRLQQARFWQEIKNLLEAEYKNANSEAALKLKLKNLTQSHTETIAQFGERARQLTYEFEQFYGYDMNNLTRKMIGEQVANQFIESVRNNKVRDALRFNSATMDLSQIVNYAMEQEIIHRRDDTDPQSICAYCHTRGHRQEYCRGFDHDLRISNITAGYQNDKICQRCGHKGHQKMHCSLKIPNLNNSQVNQVNDNGQQQQNNRPKNGKNGQNGNNPPGNNSNRNNSNKNNINNQQNNNSNNNRQQNNNGNNGNSNGNRYRRNGRRNGRQNGNRNGNQNNGRTFTNSNQNQQQSQQNQQQTQAQVHNVMQQQPQQQQQPPPQPPHATMATILQQGN